MPIAALGPVPADPPARRDWEHQAAAIAGYREMYGYDHPDDPIGSEPAREAPDQRAAWHEAFAALGRAGQPDVRAMPDGRLWLLRDAYAAQTAWVPRHAGKELRQSRLGAFDAGLSAIRAAAEAQGARKAGDHARAARHEHLAASYRSLRDLYQQREQAFAQAMASRQEWEQATFGSRRLAIAADAELRRRHPGQQIEPLRSAEPAVGDAERQHPDPIPRQKSGETAPIRDPEAPRQASRVGEVYPALRPPWRDEILQPPQPQITPSAQIRQLAAEHDIEPEAGANHCPSRHSRRRASRTRTVSLGIGQIAADEAAEQASWLTGSGRG